MKKNKIIVIIVLLICITIPSVLLFERAFLNSNPKQSNSNVPSSDSSSPSSHSSSPSSDSSIVPDNSVIKKNPYKLYSNCYKGQLHCHTNKSDGECSPEEVVAEYKKKGYDFMFITDHDKVTVPKGTDGILCLKAEELSTNLKANGEEYYVHANMFNISSDVPKSTDINKALSIVKSSKGFLQLNHLIRTENLTKKVLDAQSKDIWGIEIINYGNGNSTELWDSQISQGKNIFCTIGDDSHYMSKVGKTFVMVNSPDNSAESILSNLRDGNFYCSEGPDMKLSFDKNKISVKSTNGNHIYWYGKDMKLLKQAKGSSDTYTIKGNELFVRVVVEGNTKITIKNEKARKVRAYSQPVFVK